MNNYSRKVGIIFTASALFYTRGEGKFLDIYREPRYRPGVLPILKRLCRESYALYIVCNVPEVVDGEFSTEDLHIFYELVQDFLMSSEIRFVQIYYECNLKSRRALPHPAMPLEVSNDFGLRPGYLLMVGSEDIDRVAAERAGFDYIPADIFFRTLVPKRIC